MGSVVHTEVGGVACEIDHGGLKVCIDHGQGLFTTSSHLSRTLVGEGELVRRGQVLGLESPCLRNDHGPFDGAAHVVHVAQVGDRPHAAADSGRARAHVEERSSYEAVTPRLAAAMRRLRILVVRVAAEWFSGSWPE